MGLENSVSAIALTENRFVATSSGLQIDNTVTAYAVRIYDHGECIKRFSCHYASIRCSAVCNRGRMLRWVLINQFLRRITCSIPIKSLDLLQVQMTENWLLMILMEIHSTSAKLLQM